ncbi:MAG: ABC transporter permease subunit [Planctomycetota bacterium]|nr:ABC transporter permease subunit [Planctomycetota bacterium]
MALEVVILRELQESARKKRTYWLRFGYGAVLATPVFFVALTVSIAGEAQVQGIGLQLFQIFSVWQFILFVLLTPAVAANSIVEERDSGTLGLLMLTRLTPASILLGKLGVEFIRSALLLLSGLPLLFMATMFGGVAASQVFGAIGVTLLTILLLNSLGLAVSTLVDQNYKAVVATFLIMVIAGFLTPLCLYALAWGTNNRAIADTFLEIIHPVYVFGASVAGTLTPGNAIQFSVCTLSLCAVLLLAGRYGIRRTFIPREKAIEGPAPSSPSAPSPATPARNTKFLGEVKGRPIVWRDARRTFALSAVVACLYVVLVITVLACWAFRAKLLGFTPDELIMFASLVSMGSWMLMILAVFIRSCLLFAPEKEPGVMSSLMMTPMTDRQIILDKLHVIWKEYGLVLIGVIILTVGISLPHWGSSSGRGMGMMNQQYPLASLFANLTGLYFYACVGLYWSIKASSPGKAIAYAIVSLLIYKMISQMLFGIGFMILSLWMGGAQYIIFLGFVIVPTGLQLIIAICLFSWMSRNLRKQAQEE